jgi:hypothetical protein
MEKTMVNKSHWSFAFVNWEEKEVEFQLKVSGIKGGDFTKFQFSELFSGDGTSLSLPKENQTIASLNDGFTIRIPAKGGVLITSMEKSPIDK